MEATPLQNGPKTDFGPIRSTLTASVSPGREFNARKRNSVHDILIALGVGLLPTVFAFLSLAEEPGEREAYRRARDPYRRPND